MYIAEQLRDSDTIGTIGISETWFRPGELAIIKDTLLKSIALRNLKDAVQVHLHLTYNVLRYATVCWVTSKHDFSSQSCNTLRICTIISEIS